MNIKLSITVLFVIYIALISGCKSTAVRNVEEAPFVVPSYASMDDIKKAIIRGGMKAGWRTKTLAPGILLASYSYKRNRFGAVVKINYDHDSYQINYSSSHNLKYNKNISTEDESPEFIRDSKNFFLENNPFGTNSNQPATTEEPATIHKIYNKWVIKLETGINAELTALSQKKQVIQVSRKQAVSKPAINCDEEPVYNSSGLGKISRSSVNIRKGAGTHCNILTTVSHLDTFTLLGQKNNWYYIALNSGENGWIYASLVRKLTKNEPTVKKESSASSPPPAPTKSISIAVIRFKTLNKEAQDISLGELVSEIFTSSLVNSRNFKIIEREQLNKLIQEMEMGQTGFIEATDAVEIGKMLHADAIITGSVALLAGQIQVNARIIEIESAYVISADTRTTSYTLNNINKIANEIVAKLARKLNSQ